MKEKKSKRNPRQIMAMFCIVILLGLYVLNLILALIGSEFTRNLLKGTLAITIMLPIIMYGCMVLMKSVGHLKKNPEDDLTEEEKKGFYRMLEEKEAEKQRGRKQ